MTFSRSALKIKAKADIKGRVFKCFLPLFIPALISIGFAAIAIGPMIAALWSNDPYYTGGFISMLLDGVSGVVTLALIPLTFVGIPMFFIAVCKRKPDVSTKTAFAPYKGVDRFFSALGASILVSIATAIGFLLLIIPGIVMTYGFAMTGYVMADEQKDVDVTDAMKKSWQLMKGNKFKLFVLQLSFLGWIILGIFTLGILYIWLEPYIQATTANFYLNIAHPGALREDGFDEPRPPQGGPFYGGPGGYYNPNNGGYGGPNGGYYDPNIGYNNPNGGYYDPNNNPFGGYNNQGGYNQGNQGNPQNPYGNQGDRPNNPPPPRYYEPPKK